MTFIIQVYYQNNIYIICKGKELIEEKLKVKSLSEELEN